MPVHTFAFRLIIRFCVLLSVGVAISESLYGQFTTIINVPPDVAPGYIGSNTKINVFDGGSLPARFVAGPSDGSGISIQVNISGGSVGYATTAYSGSNFQITGGRIGSAFQVLPGSTIDLSGGSVGDGFRALPGSSVGIYGEDFRINGELIPGLDSIGTSLQVDLHSVQTLSGTLVDGTPFAFTVGNPFSSRSEGQDSISQGVLTLQRTELAPIQQYVYALPHDDPPLGIREGQTIVVAEGGELANDFNAGRGSSTIVTGGTVGSNLELVGASLLISGGSIGSNMDVMHGSTLNVSGGTIRGGLYSKHSIINAFNGSIGPGFRAEDSDVNIHGGSIDYSFSTSGVSTVNLIHGTIGFSSTITSGGALNMSGGNLGSHFTSLEGSRVDISGGTFGDRFRSKAGSQVHLRGGDFRLDGQPIEGLAEEGDFLQLDISPESVLSGNLADGTPFLLSAKDSHQNSYRRNLTAVLPPGSVQKEELAPRTLTLHRTMLPDIGPSLMTVPGNEAPQGIREGQTLVVSPGGMIHDNLNAGRRSNVVVAGGEIGANLEAFDATVSLSAGAIGAHLDAFGGTLVNLTGGSLGEYAEFHESNLVMSGGEVEGRLLLTDQSLLSLSAGTIGDSLVLRNESVLYMSHGAIGNHFSTSESRITMQDGEIGLGFNVSHGTEVDIHGGSIGAHWGIRNGSIVSISGGEFGDNLKVADDATLNISGGTLGNGIDVARGGVVNVTGGSVGAHFNVLENSTANISGGTFGSFFEAFSGSTINLFGPQFVLDGTDITDTLVPGVPWTVDARDVNLTGILSDGSPFSFGLWDRRVLGRDFDFFSANATITLTRELTMDFDGSGSVDGGDFANWRTSYRDGTTAEDFLLWQRNYGAQNMPLIRTSSTVPEPSALWVMLTGSVLVGAWRFYDRRPCPLA